MGDMMGTIRAVWGQRGSRAAAVGPGGSITTWDRSRREPLGSHYPGARPRPVVTQEVSMRKDRPHVPWAACAGRCWLQNSQASGSSSLLRREAAQEGQLRWEMQDPSSPSHPALLLPAAPCH